MPRVAGYPWIRDTVTTKNGDRGVVKSVSNYRCRDAEPNPMNNVYTVQFHNGETKRVPLRDIGAWQEAPAKPEPTYNSVRKTLQYMSHYNAGPETKLKTIQNSKLTDDDKERLAWEFGVKLPGAKTLTEQIKANSAFYDLEAKTTGQERMEISKEMRERLLDYCKKDVEITKYWHEPSKDPVIPPYHARTLHMPSSTISLFELAEKQEKEKKS